MKSEVIDSLRTVFRPEFLNRIDEIIVFHALSDDDLAAIVDRLLRDVQRRLADAGITLELGPAAKRVIASEGHDPAYGARPFKRSIQRLIENPLAKALLENRFAPGTAITVDADAGGTTLLFTSEGGESVVASAGDRRDARTSREQPTASPAATPAG